MSQFAAVSREYLRGLPEKTRLDNIKNIVQSYHTDIMRQASYGKSTYLVESKTYAPQRGCAGTWPPPFIPTTDDMIEGFKLKFPDCRVEYVETWEETQPGVRTQKKGILIDWS